MLGETEKNCKSPVRIECLGSPFDPLSADCCWLMRTAVTLTVLVQEMADCQLFITSADVLQLEIVCWSSVVSCVCELFLLLSVVACCAQIRRQASYTHRTPHARRPVGSDRCSDVFHSAFLCKVSMVVQAVSCAVKAAAVLVSGWQSVTVQTASGCLCNTSLYRLSYHVCLQPEICQKHGSDPAINFTSTYDSWQWGWQCLSKC